VSLLVLGLGALLIAAQSPTPEVVRDLRRLPPSAVAPGPSLALGGHGSGSLDGGVALPVDEPWLGVLRASRRRGYGYGHSRSVRALVRAARRAGPAVWPPRRLWIGNVAAATGGPIAPSRSHQSGLDADIVLPALEEDGSPARPQLTPVRAPGEEGDGPVLDVAATWAVVEALLSDPEAEPLWLFISTPLGDALIEHAVREQRHPQIVARAAWLLHQPSDSKAHGDHLHLRLACGASDRLAGCRDYGPSWPWLRHGREELSSYVVSEIAAAMERGTGLLGALERADRASEEEASPFALVLLSDSDPEVREAAASLLARVAPRHLLARALAETGEAPWPQEAEIKAARRSAGPLAALLAAQRLHQSVSCKRGERSLLRRWISLAQLLPEDAAAEALLGCSTKGPRVLRKRALHALARIAGQPVPGGPPRSAAKGLAKAISEAPAERVLRLAAGYLPSGAPATARSALRVLRPQLLGEGLDAMNARELLELLRGDQRQTNLMSPARRRRVWRNRLKKSAAKGNGVDEAPHGEGSP
jgi:penicillin-insensitive murein DD-endopeptidase